LHVKESIQFFVKFLGQCSGDSSKSNFPMVLRKQLSLKVTFSQMIVVFQKRQNKKAHLKLLNGLFLTFKGYTVSMPTSRSDFQAKNLINQP